MADPLLHRACPVCGDTNFTPHWQKGDLRIVRCTACGMVYANPAPAGMASGKFYDDAGAEYYLAPAKLESDYAEVRFERELKLFREFCPRGAVLDVGCSSGAFLFQLKKLWPGDYEILGTDVSGAPLDYAESRGVPVVRGNFPDLNFGAEQRTRSGLQQAQTDAPLPIGWGEDSRRPGEGLSRGSLFEAVTFWAVLEHLAEPNCFLEKAHSMLKPGGWCFILVPNLHSLAVRWLGAKYRYVYPQHLNYFSRETLTRLVEGRGFEVAATRFTHFNPLVVWQDWRTGGRDVSNRERAELLKRTTACKQSVWLRPVKVLYRAAENVLGSFQLADNLVVITRKR